MSDFMGTSFGSEEIGSIFTTAINAARDVMVAKNESEATRETAKSQVQSQDWRKFILPAAVLFGGVLLVKKAGL